jgi:hypothetical protein
MRRATRGKPSLCPRCCYRKSKGGSVPDGVRPHGSHRPPFKALAWEDADGKVWFGFNAPGYLKERHGIQKNRRVIVGA